MTEHGRKYGEKESCPFPVWNGIFDHYQKLGLAVWEFMWCIDRVTDESDSSGIGWVFGKAPVKVGDIAKTLRGANEKGVRRHLRLLVKNGYITRIRTPYGFTIGVLNSKKFGIWKRKETGQNVRSQGERLARNVQSDRTNCPERLSQNVRNKEDKAVDAAVDAAAERPAGRSELWNLIGVFPEKMPPAFRELCEGLYPTRNGQPLSDFMGLCLDGWDAMGEKRYPPEFAKAKARIKTREKEKAPSAPGLPYLESIPWNK